MFGARVFACLEWLHFVLEIREQQLEFGFGQLGDQLARVRNERAASGIGPAERASRKKGKRERVGEWNA